MLVGRIISGFGVGLLSWVTRTRNTSAGADSALLPPARLFQYIKVKYHPRIMWARFSHWLKYSLNVDQRGALACMEFTGNVAGYATSVVSNLSEHPPFELSWLLSVDRLLLLIPRFASFLADTPLYSMHHWRHPRSW
jgi:hypothetical protein